jgi:amidase
VEAAVQQIERHNPQLNAVVHKDFERALSLSEAQEHTGPFAGVPFLLKDLLGEDAGQPSTGSCSVLAGWRASEDAELVRRFKKAGVVVLGRTNTPELGIYAVTESAFRGIARNPWDLRHTPGGSSGGTGAAVAARMVPMAHGGDGGGSIRIPASHCGLVGLKPSRGRNPSGPFRGERWGGMVCEGVLTRSVRDTAVMLDHTHGADLGAPYSAPPFTGRYADQVGRDPGQLRIAYTGQALFGTQTHPDNLEAMKNTAKLLDGLGHKVEEACPEFDKESLTRAYFVLVAAGVNMAVRQTEEKIGRKLRGDELELPTWALSLIGGKVSAGEYTYHLDLVHRETRRVARFFSKWDLLLTPTTAMPPVEVGSFALKSAEKMQIRFLRQFPIRKLLDLALDQLSETALAATPNTMLFNQTGQPAISLPLFWNKAGLPIGSQLVGGMGAEDCLIRVSAQLETEQPWSGRLPPLLS